MAEIPAEPEKKRKRQRAARACELCRAKKYRCDETYPCAHCKKLNVDCIYKGDEHLRQRLYSSSYVSDLEKRVQELSNRVSMLDRLPETYSQHLSSTEQKDPSNYSTNSTHLSKPTDTNTHLSAETNGSDDDDDDDDNNEGEYRDLNAHTQNLEFHGKTSSLAFLAAIQRQSANRPGQAGHNASTQPSSTQKRSLVSAMHNETFTLDPNNQILATDYMSILESQKYYSRQSRLFIDAYFENLHFIHPIITKGEFLTRCDDLWSGNAKKQPRSFIGLYCSILSLGALIRTWEEDTIEGLDRLQWCRILFHHAMLSMGELGASNDVETVQCLIIMAKICQNQYNSNLAYLYLGWATRSCLSAGFNREPSRNQAAREPKDTYNAITKTWWGLYSLEIEVSFALGRPDGLGGDEYHNRRIPPTEGIETDILAAMVPFAHIIRKVSTSIYLVESSVHEKVNVAAQIEKEMDDWAKSLPTKISPLPSPGNESKMLKDSQWSKRQRLVLQLRYYNIRMVLYRPFLLFAARSTSRIPSTLEKAVQKCVEAATRTIEVMHETFIHHIFFRTWWYNITYTSYAASIVICYVTQVASLSEKTNLLSLIDKVVEVLDAMEESSVARKTADIFRQAVSQARENATEEQNNLPPAEALQRAPSLSQTTPGSTSAMMDMQMPSFNMDFEFDFTSATLGLDDMSNLLWNDWTGQMSGFGP